MVCPAATVRGPEHLILPSVLATCIWYVPGETMKVAFVR
jgi:hypothetical protein